MLAFASGNQLPRAREQVVVHAEQWLAEADAARVVVVDEDARLVRELRRHALSNIERLTVSRETGIVSLFAAPNRDSNILAIAHQQQLRDLPHRERQPDNTI